MKQLPTTQQLIEESVVRFREKYNSFDKYGIYSKDGETISDLSSIEAFLTKELSTIASKSEEEADFDWNVKSINSVIKNYLLPRMNNAVSKISDGYHTFNELYEFRKLYNAALFNEWANQGKYNVHKSTRHHDGEACFGGGWFIVMATLPTGQISNHYEMKDWDLFQCDVFTKAEKWDGHTAQDVLKRLEALSQKEQL